MQTEKVFLNSDCQKSTMRYAKYIRRICFWQSSDTVTVIGFPLLGGFQKPTMSHAILQDVTVFGSQLYISP